MRKNWLRSVVCLGAGFGCALGARPAAAERSLKEAVQLSLTGSLLGYSSLRLTPRVSLNPQPLAPGATEVPSQALSTTSYGLPGSGLGFGLGVGLSDNVLLGAQLLLSRSKTSLGDSSDDSTLVQFLPRVEYVFHGATSRPFLAAVAGVNHSSATSSSSISSGDLTYSSSTESSGTGFLFGGSAGVHAFISHSLAIDPAFTVLRISGSQTNKSSFSAGSTVEQGYSTSGYQVLLSIGLSAWIGGASAHSSERDEQAEPTPVAVAGPAPDPDPAPEEEPLSAAVGLPGHRELNLRVAADPNLPSVIVHLYVRDHALDGCTEISVSDNGQPLSLHVTRRGERLHGTHLRHFIAGVMPVHALTVLARPDSVLTVCGDQWQLTATARSQIHAFLAERNEITTSVSEPLEPESAPALPAAESTPAGVPVPSTPAGPAAPPQPVAPEAGSAAAPVPRVPAPAAPLPSKPPTVTPRGNTQ
jgi:hypothetical protein